MSSNDTEFSPEDESAESSNDGSAPMCGNRADCYTCLGEAGCTWCADTGACIETGDGCCADAWTSECPESNIPCYDQDGDGSTCERCRRSELCQWCHVSEGASCSSKAFCTFRPSRQGRITECSQMYADSCPRSTQVSRTVEMSEWALALAVLAVVAIMVGIVASLKLLVRYRASGERPCMWSSRQRTGRDGPRGGYPGASYDVDDEQLEAVAIREVAILARTSRLRDLPELHLSARKEQWPQHLDKDCSICLEDYEPGDVVLTLPCMHMYHKHCVTRWLSEPDSSGECPQCKTAL
mmetsp:Transcript_27465/g.80767  ORF Transcript_27465/g.80767 Transcript_27465/m.80767 type:complete len:296 (-) Transcript_27465:55-942(-)